jgi:hypothetical protein
MQTQANGLVSLSSISVSAETMLRRKSLPEVMRGLLFILAYGFLTNLLLLSSHRERAPTKFTSINATRDSFSSGKRSNKRARALFRYRLAQASWNLLSMARSRGLTFG